MQHYKKWGDANGLLVCEDCITDEYLSNEICETGRNGKCSYCHSKGKCVTLADVGERVHGVLQEQFYLSRRSNPWDDEGGPLRELIGEILGAEETVASDIHSYLSAECDPYDPRDGGEPIYDGDALYIAHRAEAFEYRNTWRSFCAHIRARSRFFSEHAKTDLDNIFGDLAAHTTHTGKQIIQPIGPDAHIKAVYRARVALTEEDLRKILKRPAVELGPPPSRLARAGRMNPAGISVFYGATDAATCMSEVRPFVGGFVVIGKFEITRPLRVLDFDALREVAVVGSHFDPNYPSSIGRATFLEELIAEMSRPVLPHDEEFSYLPTQVVCEYLATKSSQTVDGILFQSAQSGEGGVNVVLFNAVAGVEADDIPAATETDVSVHSRHSEDGEEAEEWIWIEDVIPEDGPKKTAAQEEMAALFDPGTFFIKYDDHEDQFLQQPEPSLKLPLDSVEVKRIRGVKYGSAPLDVTRRRKKKGEKDPF